MEEEKPQQEKPLNIVEEAKKIRDEIKAENDRREEILKKEQQLKANEMLGGTAGGNVKTLTPEEAKQAKSDAMAKEMTDAFK